MINTSPRIFTLILPLFLALLSQGVQATNEFRVIASIKPVHSILAGLMEGIEPPELLISGESTPFDYELSPGQADDMALSRLVVWVGPELEQSLVDPIAELSPNTTVITLLDNPNLKILDSRWNMSMRDPYFWLDSRNGLILIDELTQVLVSIDPGRSHLYKRNRNIVNKRMGRLDRELEYGYRGLKKGLALSYYDTLQYFEQAYALKIGEALAESPITPMEATKFLDVRAKLAGGDYSCLLIESQLKMPNLELLVDGIDIGIGRLDSLGTSFEAGSDLYFDLMEHNTGAVKDCFQRADTVDNDTPKAEETTPPEEFGGPFMLVDQNGNLFTNKDMQDKYQLIFFGYTSCPDVCPTSLLVGTQALKNLGVKSEKIQPYFISVDPERDKPDVMGKYVRYFSEDLIGLTGSNAMFSRVAKYYNVKYEKVYEADGDSNSYAMDHTASIFLMSPDGQFMTKFPYGTTSDQLASKLEEYVR